MNTTNERLQNSIYFMLSSLIWGSTWYAIKFQLGVVNPILSVSYRFIIASAIFMLFCLFAKLSLKFSRRQHLYFFIQGITLFGLNYWLVYLSEQYLTSGIVAVIFSLIIFFNMIFSALFMKTRITRQILIGGILAISGTILIFKKEFSALLEQGVAIDAIILCLGSLVLASLGNVASAFNQKQKLPIIQTNAFGMLYGALSLFIIGLFKGIPLNFDTRSSYLLSLLYLALFGSVVAFTSYLKILGRIGPAKAAYAVVLTPVIAMIVSTFFESYVWQSSALIGIPVLLLGNLIAMDRIKPVKLFDRWK